MYVASIVTRHHEGSFAPLVSMAAGHIRPCRRAIPGQTQRLSCESLRPILCHVLLAVFVQLDALLLQHGRYGWNDDHADKLSVLGREYALSDQPCLVHAYQMFRIQHYEFEARVFLGNSNHWPIQRRRNRCSTEVVLLRGARQRFQSANSSTHSKRQMAQYHVPSLAACLSRAMECLDKCAARNGT